jgi:hypothetical protein
MLLGYFGNALFFCFLIKKSFNKLLKTQKNLKLLSHILAKQAVHLKMQLQNGEVTNLRNFQTLWGLC